MITNIERVQKDIILKDLEKKMVFIVGPRQVGKTWLSKEIMRAYKKPLYLSYDSEIDRKKMREDFTYQDYDLIVFDEIHKMRGWKNFLKGFYDTKPEGLHMLITGSARLDAYKNVGDSMAGRYRTHHLLPLDSIELQNNNLLSVENFNRLIQVGGFPEPFTSNEDRDIAIWRKNYNENLLREDVLNFQNIDDLNALKNVFEILRSRTGSPISYASIAEDVGIAPKTVKNYISILESLYIVFLVRPYTKKVKRSILKEPKVYFYDTGLVKGGEGIQFENLIAVSLLKYAYRMNDEQGIDAKIATLRNKEKQEVDFVIVKNDEIDIMIEVKLSDTKPHPGLVYFEQRYTWKAIQVVKNMRHPQYENGVTLQRAQDFLVNLLP